MSNKIKVQATEGFNIFFEAREEYSSLEELLPDHTKEQHDEIYRSSEIFMAKVTAERHGVELASEYLGGCIYETEEEFYTTYKDGYFADMVNTVVKEANEAIENLQKP